MATAIADLATTARLIHYSLPAQGSTFFTNLALQLSRTIRARAGAGARAVPEVPVVSD